MVNKILTILISMLVVVLLVSVSSVNLFGKVVDNPRNDLNDNKIVDIDKLPTHNEFGRIFWLSPPPIDPTMYEFKVGDKITVEGKQIELMAVDYRAESIKVNVDGIAKVIFESNSTTINGLQIVAEDVDYPVILLRIKPI